METTREIIATIGRERFAEMLDIGPKSVSRSETKNIFTASWMRAIEDELKALGHPPPSRDLFNFKDRIPISES